MDNDSQNTAIGTTIEEYLRGCVGFEVADSAITTILIDREIVPGTDVTTLEKRQKDSHRIGCPQQGTLDVLP